MAKPKLATCTLAGCFGCHMSFLDIDERLIELAELADLDKSPLDDKKQFDCLVDVGLVEGGCANEHDVHVLRQFRKNCRVLVSVGACAITGTGFSGNWFRLIPAPDYAAVTTDSLAYPSMPITGNKLEVVSFPVSYSQGCT